MTELEQQMILDSIPAWVFYKDKENRFISVNRKFCQVMGKTRKELEGRSMWDLYPKEQADAFWRDDQAVIASGQPKTNIIEPLKIGDKEYWVQTDKIPYRDQNGKIIGVIGFTIDITEQKKTEDKLKESRLFLDQIINSVGDPIFVKDRKHRWVLLNDAFCAFMGKQREELLGKSDHEFFPKAEADIFWEKDEAVFSSGRNNINEESFTDAKGMPHTIVTHKTLYTDENGSQHIVGVISDITSRKQSEMAVKESEARYRSIFESSRDAIMIISPPDWEFTSANPATLAMFKARDEADLFSHGPWQLSPEQQPDGKPSRDKARAMIETALREGSSFFEWTHQRLNGKTFPAEVSLSKIERGQSLFVQAIVRDITDRKQAEETLKTRAAELERLNKLMVGRELKMIELKEELARAQKAK